MAAPRSIWNGTISFGLVNVPVKVHSATEDKGIHFHEVHAADGARIEHKRFCSKEGKEVPFDEVVKGYETAKSRFVVLSKDEIAAAAGEASHVIEIEDFVCAAEIDPVYYDRTYYLGARDAPAAYRLLLEALAKAERVGIGRWVFHNREYLVAVRPLEHVLALHTVRFHDELVASKDLDVGKPGKAPSKQEADMASRLIDSLHGPFEPADFEDTYRARVLDMIKAKAKGKRFEPPGVDAHEELDLAAALKASL